MMAAQLGGIGISVILFASILFGVRLKVVEHYLRVWARGSASFSLARCNGRRGEVFAICSKLPTDRTQLIQFWPRWSTVGCLFDLIVTGSILVPMSMAVKDTVVVLPYGLPLGASLFILAILDLRWKWLPNQITLTVAACGLAAGALDDHLLDSMTGLIWGGGILLLLRAAYRAAHQEEGIGMGDVKLIAGCGAWLGPVSATEVLLWAALLALLCSAAQALVQGHNPRLGSEVPFGAYICSVFWIGWLGQ